MNFIRTIARSVYCPSFYASLREKPFRSAIGYFVLLVLLLTVVRTIAFAIPALTELPRAIDEGISTFENSYPDDLVIAIHEGQVQTNVSEPYFIRLNGADDANVLVIDTKTPYSATQFRRYHAVVWLGRDSVFVDDNESSQIRGYDLSSINDLTIDRSAITSVASAIRPWVKFVGPIVTLIAAFVIFSFYLWRLLYLLALALVIWLLSTIMKQTLTYGRSYKVGLYGMTTAFLLEAAFSLAEGWLHFTGFPFMFSLVTLGVISINLLFAKHGATTQLPGSVSQGNSSF